MSCWKRTIWRLEPVPRGNIAVLGLKPDPIIDSVCGYRGSKTREHSQSIGNNYELL
jgi:hypothetical protein